MHPFAIEGQTLLPFDSTSTTFSSREKQIKREVHAVPYVALMLPGLVFGLVDKGMLWHDL